MSKKKFDDNALSVVAAVHGTSSYSTCPHASKVSKNGGKQKEVSKTRFGKRGLWMYF